MRSVFSKTLQGMARARRAHDVSSGGKVKHGTVLISGQDPKETHFRRSLATKSRKNLEDVWNREIREAKERDREKNRIHKSRKDAENHERAFSAALQALDPVRLNKLRLCSRTGGVAVRLTPQNKTLHFAPRMSNIEGPGKRYPKGSKGSEEGTHQEGSPLSRKRREAPR